MDAELLGIRCTLMNIYAPTADLPGFFVDISNAITQFGNSYIILGGDFNKVRDPKVDKTYNWGVTRPSQAQKAIDTMEEELDLVDVWRFIPPFGQRIYLLFPSTYFLFKNRLFSDFKIIALYH